MNPDCILVDARGHAYLSDFGGAAVDPSAPQLGMPGDVNYCAPEQIRGAPLRATTDVYSLTAVLYACLTGQAPYRRGSDDAVVRAHLRDRPPAVPGGSSGVAALNRVIARGMAKKRRERYARASDLSRDGVSLLASMPASRRHARPAFPANTGGEATPVLTARRSVYGTEDLEHRDWMSAAALTDPAFTHATEAPASALQTDDFEPEAERDSAARSGDDAIGEPRAGVRARAAFPVLRAMGIIVGVIAVIVAGSAGLLVLLTPGRSSPPVARTGPLLLAYRAPWRTGSAAGLGVSALRNPIVLRSSGVTLSAGLLRNSPTVAAGPPPQLEHSFGVPSTRNAVRIAGRPGMRYTWKVANTDQLVVQVLAMPAADLSIVCAAPTSAAGDMASCLALTARARLAAGTHSLPPGPSPATDAQLEAALQPALSARLDAPGLNATPLPGRAAAARTVALADQRSAAMLDALAARSLAPAPTAGVVAALREQAGAFSALAAASAADDRGAYTAARSRALAALSASSIAITRLANAGFSVHSLAAVAVPAAPAAPKPKSERKRSSHKTPARTHRHVAAHPRTSSLRARTNPTRTTPPTTPATTDHGTTAPAVTAPVRPASTTTTTRTTTTSTTTTSATSTSTATKTPKPTVHTPPPRTPSGGSGSGQTISGSGSV